MRLLPSIAVALALRVSAVCISGQALAPQPVPAGKPAPRPLYRDPPLDAPTDPVLCYNAEQGKWFMCPPDFRFKHLGTTL
jgi:hypothetical protein